MEPFITNPNIDALLRQGCVREAFDQPVKERPASYSGISAFLSSRNASELGKEDEAMAALTFGDFLYDFLRINPDVVHAVEFSRTADVNSVLSFAHFADVRADFTGASLEGLHSDLQGYVAEQLVSHHLVAHGHDVVFPETANNPGWDLKVDGHPFQVKCLAGRGGVLEHFHDYPDIPVIVNAELAGQVGDMPSVYVDSELHHDAVRQMTEDSLRHGQDISDLNVPWISLGVSGAFNFHYMLKNDTDLGSMLVCTATDTGARVVVGSIGKYAGSAAGLLVFGPAGAIVMGLAGTVGGSMVGRRAIAAGRRILVCNEEKAVCASVRKVADAAASAMPRKLDAWTEKAERLQESLSGTGTNRQKIRDVFADRMAGDIGYWKAKQSELDQLARDGSGEGTSLVDRVLRLVRRAGIHAHHVQDALKDLGSAMERLRAATVRFRTS